MTQRLFRLLPLAMLPLALLLVVALAGCQGGWNQWFGGNADDATAPEGKVLARVNGTPITETEIGHLLRGGHGGIQITPEMKADALEKVIELELLYQDGKAAGLDQDPKYRQMIDRLEMQLRMARLSEMKRRVYNSRIAATVDVSEEDARAYYDAHKEQIGTELNLATVAFRDAAHASQSEAALRDGKSFDEVAAEANPNAAKKGEKPWNVGWIAWNRIPLEWTQPLYSLKAGEVSEVLHGERTGIRIFKVIDKRENPKADFESMKGAIMARLKDERVQAAYRDYLAKLREKADIERVNEP